MSDSTLDSIPFDANLPAVWLEAMIYGIYSCLFFQTVIIARKRSPRTTTTARVFQNATIVLYTIATFHVSIGLYRVIRGFIYTEPFARMGYWYGSYWENTAYYCSQAVMGYIGQGLLIYRCYMIYNSNWLIVTPSIILYIASTGVSIYLNYMWTTPGGRFVDSGVINAILPLTLVQHTGTPCLTVYRLLRQHHESRMSGIHHSRTRLNLQTVSMIIMESTFIYSIVIITAIVLSAYNSNNKQIAIVISVPTLGFCFSLITIRLHNLNRYESEKSTVFSVGQFAFNTTTTTGISHSEAPSFGDSRTEDTKTDQSSVTLKFIAHPEDS